MRYIDVGTGKRISKIGLGTHQFGSPDWDYGGGYAGQDACAIVRRALELGVTLFDTAEIYGFEASRIARRAVVEGVALSDVARTPGFGRGERILGRALGDMRESAFLATKFYPAVPAAPVPEQRAVASANRLGTRHLDLYQVHQPDRIVPGSNVMDGVRALQQAGMVGEVGVSNASLERWHAAEQALGSRVLSIRSATASSAAHPSATCSRSPSPTAAWLSPTARWNWDCWPARTIAPTARPTRSGPRTRSSCRRTSSVSVI